MPPGMARHVRRLYYPTCHPCCHLPTTGPDTTTTFFTGGRAFPHPLLQHAQAVEHLTGLPAFPLAAPMWTGPGTGRPGRTKAHHACHACPFPLSPSQLPITPPDILPATGELDWDTCPSPDRTEDFLPCFFFLTTSTCHPHLPDRD